MSEKIKKEPSNSWFLLALVLLAAIAPALTMFKVSPVMEQLITDFSINSAQAGLVSTLFSIVPIILSIPVGVIVSKYGNWRLGLLSLFFLICGSAIGALSHGLPSMFISRMIEGAGMALIGTVGPNIVNAIFKPEKRGVAMGVFVCYMSMGQALINTVAPGIISVTNSWRGLWWFTAMYSMILLALWFFFLRKTDTNDDKSESPKLSVGNALKNPSMWMLCVAMFLFCMAVQGLVMFYTSFFVQVKGMTDSYAAHITSLHGYIGCLGAVVSGIIMDKLHSRKYFAAITMAVCAVLFWSMPYFPPSLSILQILLVGFTANLFPPIIFSGVPEVCAGPADIPLSLGVANTGLNLGTLVSGIVFGTCIDKIGWNSTFVFIGTMAVLCGISMLFVKKLKR